MISMSLLLEETIRLTMVSTPLLSIIVIHKQNQILRNMTSMTGCVSLPVKQKPSRVIRCIALYGTRSTIY